MSDVGCEANRRWRKEEFLLMLIFSSCWIRHISMVDYYINRWSWTDFIVDVEKKCWTADWLLMLVVILIIRWILHHSAYHTALQSQIDWTIEPWNHWTKNLKSLKNMVCCRQQIESVKEKSTTFNRIWIHTFVKVTFIVITFFRRKGTTN